MSPSAGSRRSREGWRETADPALATRLAGAIFDRGGDRDRVHRDHHGGGGAAAVQAARRRHLGVGSDQPRKDHDPEARPPADDPADRVRSPHRRAVSPVQHRHDDARPPRRGLFDDQRDVGAARPQGGDSRGWWLCDRQDQRRVLGRGAQPAGEGAQERVPRASDQPHHRRQLRRLRGSRQRGRLRVHRRRSPLLQQHHSSPTIRASTCSPATSACVVRTPCRSCDSATPTQTSCETRASRTSCAGPRRSTASDSWSPTETSCCGSSASTRRPTPICTRSTGS